MALEVSKKISGYAGQVGTYLRTIETNINWVKREAHVTVGLYLNEEHSNEDPFSPLSTYSYDFDNSNFPFQKGDVLAEAYVAIKDLSRIEYIFDDKNMPVKDENGVLQTREIKLWEEAKDA